MTLTSRIRLYLILIAVLPVVVVTALIWRQVNVQAEQADQRQAEYALERYLTTRRFVLANITSQADKLADDPNVQLTLNRLQRSDVSTLDIAPDAFGLGFAEIVDSSGIVLASASRPGLLGQEVHERFRYPDSNSFLLETVEYDRLGPHASQTVIYRIRDNRLLYCGKYIDAEAVARTTTLIESPVKLTIEPETTVVFEQMEPLKLYRTDAGFQAVLNGSDSAAFYLTALFETQERDSTLLSLLGLAGLVGLISMFISIMIGLYITGRAKREIENLVNATERVSRGDLNTPIMAYEEGEFSQLADSFSQMLIDLKRLQADLATSEKIAAWETMGRKIAHEIKNPMTPIAISADDLRRSYHENLPNFGNILDETTGTIKSEVDRLSRLLDQFVKFARMAPPSIRPTDLNLLLSELTKFYAREIENHRFSMENNLEQSTFPLDRDAIWQVLINLIKNSLETGASTVVKLFADSNASRLTLTIKDNGPGFPDDFLTSSVQPRISTKKDGSGLGLIICERIVRDHGGQMKLYNQPEGGAAVELTLPV